MALTALEWLLLSEDEQRKRQSELSVHECFLLRTSLSQIKFTEEQKRRMTPEEKYNFTHPKEYTQEEREAFNKKAQGIFEKMKQEVNNYNR